MSTAFSSAEMARSGTVPYLRASLIRARDRTLSLLACYEQALGQGLRIPYDTGLNPPLWENGHVAWFQEWWLARNPERHLGCSANPDAPRAPSVYAKADEFFNSSNVAHALRWELAVGNGPAIRAYLADTLAQTLALLDSLDATQCDDIDSALYFFRLALFHEQMHSEAAVYMARQLGVDCRPFVIKRPLLLDGANRVSVPGGTWHLGQRATGFQFDNECGHCAVNLGPFEIDTRPVSWGQWMEGVMVGRLRCPQGFRIDNGEVFCTLQGWESRIDLHSPVVHVNLQDALNYCDWVGRQLPNEAQWEMAAFSAEAFQWGQVWEWTSSPFAPFEGFKPHPYRDYSKPWFGTHQVLKGACEATDPDMMHPKYRNYFLPHRTDIFSGFRTCRELDTRMK